VTGLVAAEEVASSQEPVARMQRARFVYVDMDYSLLLATGCWVLATC
jgi:hypothetical protein